jgi:hypothetical protein
MNAFLIELDNKVGELARISEAIASKKVNITGISGATCGGSGSLALMTDDDPATRTALQGAGCSFREMEVAEATLPNVPGSLAKAARRLADGGVNIEALMPTGMQGNDVSVAFVTADPAKARSILSTAGSATA